MKFTKVAFASILLGVSALSMSISPAQAADNKSVVVLDYTRVVQQSKLYQESEQAFQKRFEERYKDLDKRRTDLEAQYRTLAETKQKLDADLKAGKVTGAALKKREDAWKASFETFQQTETKLQEDMQKFEQERSAFEEQELNRVKASVQKIIDEYASKSGFVVVLDLNNTVYHSSSADITEEVLKLVK